MGAIVDSIVDGMIQADQPSQFWEGYCPYTFPALRDSHFTIQRNGKTVFEHTMDVINLVNRDPVTLLSGLFHDLGKCRTPTAVDPSLPKFPGHEQMSGQIAREMLSQWGASSSTANRVCRLVLTHMYDIIGVSNPHRIRNFVATVGIQDIDRWFDLRVADSSSYPNQNKYRRSHIDPFRLRVMAYVRGFIEKRRQDPLQQDGGPRIEGVSE